MNRRPGNAQNLLGVFPWLKKFIIALAAITAIALVIIVIGVRTNGMFSTAQEFYLNAGEEKGTVLVGPGTHHAIWANKPWKAISGGGTTRKEWNMPQGWSTWDGGRKSGPLGAKGLYDGTILNFQ